MGKRLVTEECFPGIRNDVQLTEPIPLEDLSALLYQHYDVIVELLPTLFPPHSAGAFELQPSRGKMGALRERIEKTLGISDATTTCPGIETIGDARRFGKRARKILAEARDAGTTRKDKMMNVRVHDLCKTAVNETVAHLMHIIANRIPEGAERESAKPARKPPKTKAPHVVKQETRQASKPHHVSGNGRVSEPAPVQSTRVSRAYETAVYQDAPEDDGDDDIIGGVSWRKALRDPDRMIRIFLEVDQVAPAGEEHLIKRMLPACVTYQAFRSERNVRENYDFAARALHELRTAKRISLQHPPRENTDAWSLVFACIKNEVLAEIASGDTFFDISELDVAFDVRIVEYGLGSRYKQCKKTPVTVSGATDTTTNAEDNHEEDASAKGFTKTERARIPREDRIRINDLFRRVSVAETRVRGFKSFTETDAEILCDIARIILTHQDTLGSQFRERLGVPDGLVWKVIQDHEYSLLTQPEADALPVLEKELSALDEMKNNDIEECEQRKIDSMPRIVLLRRLLRLEHAHDYEEKLERLLQVVDMEETALAAKEWKVFLGLSNHDLAPDLFEKEDANADEDLTEILEELALLGKRSKESKYQRKRAERS